MTPIRAMKTRLVPCRLPVSWLRRHSREHVGRIGKRGAKRALPRSRCVEIRSCLLGRRWALRAIPALRGRERRHPIRPFHHARVEQRGLRNACRNRFLCDFRLLHSHSFYRQREAGDWTLLCTPLHTNSDTRRRGPLSLPALWAEVTFLGRALDSLGIASLEPPLRGDLLRGLPVSALFTPAYRLGNSAFLLVCGGHLDCRRTHTRPRLGVGGTAWHRYDSAPHMASWRPARGASRHAPCISLRRAHLVL